MKTITSGDGPSAPLSLCCMARQLAVGLWLVAISAAPAQSVVQAWVQRYNGPGNGDDHASAVAVAGSGNVFVTGSSYAGGYADYATLAYSGAGEALWTNRYNGPGNSNDIATAVAVDGSGNVFVTGSSYAGGHADYATLAYSGAGEALWTNRYNGPGNSDDIATAVAVDGSGNVFVTGSSVTIAYSGAGAPLWTNSGSGTTIAGDGSGNVFVTGSSATIAYSGAGVPLWTNRYSGPESATDVAVDGNGNVFVTGYSYVSGDFPDYETIKYSGAGELLWSNRYDGPEYSYDYATAVAVDGSGNVFVTGYSFLYKLWYADYVTVAYSGAGVPLWTNRYDGPGNNYDQATAVGVDGSGNVIVTGHSYSSSGNFDYATVAYSSAGVPLWTNRYNGPANEDDQPQTKSCLAIGPDGSVYVTGASEGNYAGVTFDFATVKYITVPVLAIEHSATDVILSWPSAFSDFVLQQSSSLSPPAWANAPSGTNNPATIPVTGPARFYRLKKP